ncbi:MAG: OmpA family protein [Prevotellaceae bacterium]|jgi:hypothetical protein|nr:OmpA family protein [Prevotellaceae bacterium]
MQRNLFILFLSLVMPATILVAGNPPVPADSSLPTYSILFRPGETMLDENYRDNRTALDNLVEVLTLLAQSDDHHLSRITIEGHASPQGGAAGHMPMSHQRALAVKHYLEERIDLSDEHIVVADAPVDWEQLKRLIRNSNMYEKYQVLDIIERVPEWDARRKIGRMGQIMLMHHGSTYRYLQREFFPKMHHAADVKVAYTAELSE